MKKIKIIPVKLIGKKAKCLRCGKPLSKYEEDAFGSYCAECNDYLEQTYWENMQDM